MSAMRLDDLLRGIATPAGDDMMVSGLTQDSREVRAGDAFVALAGATRHGIEFAEAAIEKGAVAILAEKTGPGSRDQGPETGLCAASAGLRSPVPVLVKQGPGSMDQGSKTGLFAASAGLRSPVLVPVKQGPGSMDQGSKTGLFAASAGPRSPVPVLVKQGPGNKDQGSKTGLFAASAGPRSPVPVIYIDNLRSHLGAIAARFYGDPSTAMTLIGVTGTSGKTSTVQLLAQALTHLNHRAATIGTLGAGLHGAIRSGERTTPDAIRVHGLLAEFRDAGATHVAMEVSSHALDQHRVDGVDFDVAVFTNLTRDHLDYHGTMEAYGAAKAKLFAWPNRGAAIINVDDSFGRDLATRISSGVRVIRCGLASNDTDIRARDVHTHSEGIDFKLATPWGTAAVQSRLLGRFNVANLLVIVGVLGALDVPFNRIVDALQSLEPVAGRMNRLGGGSLPLVVVDYSHKPDALEQVLVTLRAHCEGQLICVFGCGGERDAGKRPLMGAIAERLADVAIVTDDNPRGEDGDTIVAQILQGMHAPEHAKVERDRARAIDLAIARARAGDVVLIAGKGHETYQESGGAKRPFDDFQVARAALEACPC